MQAGWNPVKRNKHIGTAQQGHGQTNRLVIPDSSFPVFMPRDIKVCRRQIHEQEFTFLIAPPRKGYVHPCTIEDICYLLQHVSAIFLEDVDNIFLYQPTRKEETLKSIWGRLIYYADIGRYSGRTICLNAQNPQEIIKLSLSRTPEMQKEIERLERDGHAITRTRREYHVTPTLAALRTTLLLRTLLHEVGHSAYIMHKFVELEFQHGEDLSADRFIELYQSVPEQEMEQFADSFADNLHTILNAQGTIPFAQKFSLEDLHKEGIPLAWFDLSLGKENVYNACNVL